MTLEKQGTHKSGVAYGVWLKQGYDIYDIGPDGRIDPSKFYEVEQIAIKTHKYPTVKLPAY